MIGTREAGTSAPPDRGVEIWFADLTQCGAALEAIEKETPRLSDDDCARLETTAGAKEWRWRRATHIALRIIIERILGAQWRKVPYVFGDTGRLALPDSQGDFSLAHADGYALIGVTRRGRIGVDLERTRDIKIAANRQRAIIAAAAQLVPDTALPEDDTAGFIQAWVCLEAFAKADGRGIGHVLTVLGARGQKEGASPGPGTAKPPYTVVDLALGSGFFGAVALGNTPVCPVTVCQLPTEAPALSELCAAQTKDETAR